MSTALLLPPRFEVALSLGRPALCSPEDRGQILCNLWSLGPGGYAYRGLPPSLGWPTTLFMHQVVMARMGFRVPPGYEIDHINWDRLDNRRENLRVLTRGENRNHRQLNPHNTSGHNGVTYDRARRRWVARLGELHCGYYAEKADAVAARERAAARYVDLSHKAFPLLPGDEPWLRRIGAY